MDIKTLLLTLFISIVGAFATSYFAYRFYSPRLQADLQKEFKSRFNERKWDAYTKFANILYQLLESIRKGDTDKKMPKYISQMNEFLSLLWVVGSDEVVNSVSEWLRYSRMQSDVDEKGAEGLVRLINIVIEMRKDLGNKESNLSPKDLLSTFVVDIDEYLIKEKEL